MNAQTVIDKIKNIAPRRLAIMIIAAAAAMIFVAWVIVSQGSRGEMGLLYSGLGLTESAKVTARLDAIGVRYELRAGGDAIYVRDIDVAKTRMALARDGLPSSQTEGYEILDKQNPMGMTGYMQRVQRIRALEGELSRTIMAVDGIKEARVHVVMPERESFARQAPEPSASVLLRVERGARVTEEQALGIRRLVSAAIPRLRQEMVTVADQSGVVLGEEIASSGGGPNKLLEMKRVREVQMTRNLEQMLSPVVGMGKVKVSVALELTQDREIVRERSFDPASQVARSTQTVGENERKTERTPQPPVSAAQNTPNDRALDRAATAETSKSRNEDTTNFEISTVDRERERAPGEVRRLTVAVLVDGNYGIENGARVYRPRTGDEIERLRGLVRDAVGYDQRRGDSVTVENVQFAPEVEEREPTFLEKNLIGMAQVIALMIAFLLVLMFIVRPIIQRILQAPEAIFEDEVDDAPVYVPSQGESEELINLESVEGRIKASSMRRMSEIIERHPNEAAQLIRSWLHEQED
jgi:flagellar M-ring protein FliF